MMSQVYPQDNSSDLSCCRSVVDKRFCSDAPSLLTVWKKSLIFGSEGFTVYDSRGDLVFRVDSYASGGLYDEIILMDADGKPLLTLCRKIWLLLLPMTCWFAFRAVPVQIPSLHNRWEGFLGDKADGNNKPLFTVRRSSILPSSWSPVEVFFMNPGFYWKPCADYHIEGSFSQHSCTIYTCSSPRRTVAEVKRKCGAPGVVLKDVFSLSVEPGFDKAFIMGLIVILDNISGNSGDLKMAVVEEPEPAAAEGGEKCGSVSPLDIVKPAEKEQKTGL